MREPRCPTYLILGVGGISTHLLPVWRFFHCSSEDLDAELSTLNEENGGQVV